MIYDRVRSLLPAPLARYVMHFETAIESAVSDFAKSLPPGARVLDAGAGEGNYKAYFAAQRYLGLDLAVGDAGWDYSRLDAVGDLTALPFRDAVFEASLNVVTLEHVKEPGRVLKELGRTLAVGRKTAPNRPTRVGRTPAAARLLSLHTLRTGVSAVASRIRCAATFNRWEDSSVYSQGEC